MRLATDVLLPFGHASLCERAAINSRPLASRVFGPKCSSRNAHLVQADFSHLELRKAELLACQKTMASTTSGAFKPKQRLSMRNVHSLGHVSRLSAGP
jgi:hypothetical protein